MHKIISVITINFNHLEGLKNTFRSIVGQTGRSQLEWIVIDGNSTDGSATFLRDNASEFDLLVIESDKGIYDAMNKGLRAAKSEYVWFMNSGDTMHSQQSAAAAIELIQAGNPDIVYSDTMFVTPEMQEIGKISDLKPQPFPKALTFNSFRFGMNICHQSFIVRKSITQDYDLQYRQAADVDWIIQILTQNPTSVVSNTLLANFEVGGSSYQHTKKAWKERFDVLTKHYGLLPNLLAHVWIIIRRVLFNLKLKFKNHS
jgi:glycosyltransferase involved in cell wall biosynthesis